MLEKWCTHIVSHTFNGMALLPPASMLVTDAILLFVSIQITFLPEAKPIIWLTE